MTSKETPKLTNHALNRLSKVVDCDTEATTIDLNLLENLNTNQSLNYIKLEQHLNTLEKDAKQLEQLNSEYSSYSDTLKEIEEKVVRMEDISKDLDAWSKELEIKVKSKS